jgi:hypothetical protein
MKVWIQLIKSITLTKAQLEIIRDILKEIGLVFLASWSVAPLATGYLNLGLMVAGLILTLIFWYTTIEITSIISKKNDH